MLTESVRCQDRNERRADRSHGPSGNRFSNRRRLTSILAEAIIVGLPKVIEDATLGAGGYPLPCPAHSRVIMKGGPKEIFLPWVNRRGKTNPRLDFALVRTQFQDTRFRVGEFSSTADLVSPRLGAGGRGVVVSGDY